MKYTILASSTVGKKSEIAAQLVEKKLKEKMNTGDQVSLINLKEKNMVFSDGRNYLDYPGDTGEVLNEIMEADVFIITSPIFQASIPASLKNIFDLLPQNALQHKTVSFLVTSGTSKHFLVAEHSLKPILSYMKAQIVPNYVYILDIDYQNDQIVSDDAHFRIDRLIEDTQVLAKTYSRIVQEQEEQYGF